MKEIPQTQFDLPQSHRGEWAGPNRLWVTDPTKPFRSDGTIELTDRVLHYTWAHEGKEHSGTITLSGQPEAMEAAWLDSWHAADGMTLHGFEDHGRVLLFCTYDAGGTPWGWRIEIDLRDPEACVLRMFNVVPGFGVVPAVLLRGTR
ncbi:MAG: hypothetical protein AAGG07_13405 [Planctomycetota bacterium]